VLADSANLSSPYDVAELVPPALPALEREVEQLRQRIASDPALAGKVRRNTPPPASV